MDYTSSIFKRKPQCLPSFLSWPPCHSEWAWAVPKSGRFPIKLHKDWANHLCTRDWSLTLVQDPDMDHSELTELWMSPTGQSGLCLFLLGSYRAVIVCTWIVRVVIVCIWTLRPQIYHSIFSQPVQAGTESQNYVCVWLCMSTIISSSSSSSVSLSPHPPPHLLHSFQSRGGIISDLCRSSP